MGKRGTYLKVKAWLLVKSPWMALSGKAIAGIYRQLEVHSLG